MDQEDPEEGRRVTAEERLAPFLMQNPVSKVRADDGKVFIEKAWGEEAIELSFSIDDISALDALNHVVLPGRYSAIWHTDSQDLEVIFSAYSVRDGFEDLATRRFEFTFSGRSYHCEFDHSSERLITIAAGLETKAASQTQWRNLITLQRYSTVKKKLKEIPEIFDPRSFWIRSVDLNDEDTTLLLVNHLNFYMTYFDTSTPRVLVHPQTRGAEDFNAATRFPHGKFPLEITAGSLDEVLWHFWDASVSSADPFRRFLYNYQIIEYAAEYYVEEEVKRSIRRLLTAPDFNSNIDVTTTRMIDLLAPKKNSEIQKRSAILKNCVDAEAVWTELQRNRAYFEKKVIFQGGYPSEPVLARETSFASWKNNWGNTFEGAVRHIRNGLSHGRESSTTGVISPTIANQELIEPWLGPLMVAARQVMLYRGVV